MFHHPSARVWTLILLMAAGAVPSIGAELPGLKVSDNGRFLVTETGSPFFWLGDTTWNLFQRTSRKEAPDQPAIEKYFAARARQGFTVIQATLVMGIKANTYGHDPFTKGDSPRAKVGPGPEDDYWDVADRLIEMGEKHDLHMALLPIWLDSLSDKDPIVRDAQVAYRYGQFLGSRYRVKTHLVWVLGGDPWGKGKDVDNPVRLAMTRALAEGIADGVNGIDRQDGQADYSTTLMSFHPKGNHHSSSELLHTESWLDFNMIQTTTHFSVHNYETVAIDYGKMPGGDHEFVPPSGGPDNDWVLVLDDATQVRSVPVRASQERVEGVPPSNRGQDARDTAPHGVTTNVRQWSVYEIELTAQSEFTNPYTDVEVAAQFSGPGGKYVVRGFWDGGRTFRVRFTPPTRGKWTYATQSVPPDAGLTRTGAFEAAAPTRSSHGFLRRDARYPTCFVFDDGTRHFMWGTTYYHLLLNARVGDRWKEAVDGAVRYGMNKARFSLYPSPVKGDVGRYPISSPFTDKDLTRPNLDHWRAGDKVVRYMAERGFLADIILFWTKPKGSEALLRQDEQYLRYALARYAAFPNVIWCIVNEWNYSEVPQDYWNHLGRLVREEDPWSREGEFLRALSIHQQTRPDWNFADQTWPSHAILQFGVRNHGASVRIGNEWTQAGQGSRRFQHGDEWGNHSIVRNWTGKYPLVNDEYGYLGEPQDVSEDRLPDGSFQRFTREKHRNTMWAIAVGGGYGAAGDKNDYDDGRPYFSANWHDTPEYGDIRQLVTFFTKGGLQYWKMAPHNELIKSGTRVYGLAEPGRQYVVYTAAGTPFSLDLLPGRYLAHRLDPRTGEHITLPEVMGGAIRDFTTPDRQDWVFYLTRKDNEG